MKPLPYFLIVLLLSTPVAFIAAYLPEVLDAIGIGVLLIIAFYAFAMYRVEKCFKRPEVTTTTTKRNRTPEEFIEFIKTLG